MDNTVEKTDSNKDRFRLHTGEGEPDITDISNLFGNLKNLPNVKVNYGFFTTYDGLEIPALEKMLMSLPAGNGFIYEGEYDIFCGAKSSIRGTEQFLSELLMKHIHRVIVNGSFHPKIYLVKYQYGEDEENQKDEILLIIASKNITCSSFLDAYVILRGTEAVSTKETNGKSLLAILSEKSFGIDSKYIEKLKCIESYNFSLWDDPSPVISFYRPCTELLNGIHFGTSKKYPLIVVSPFVSNGIFGESSYIRLYSTENTLDRISGSLNDNIESYKCNCDNGNESKEKKYPSSLHAKIYVKLNDGKTEVYIGSANYTKSAFSLDNSEILTKISYEDEIKYEEIKESFETEDGIWGGYDKSNQEPGKESTRISGDVYRYISKNIKVEISGTCLKYSINGNEVSAESANNTVIVPAKDDMEKKWHLCISRISPANLDDISRNVDVVFRCNKEGDLYQNCLEGELSLDLLDLINDPDKNKVNQLLDEKIKKNLAERKEQIIRTGKYVRRKKKEFSEESESENKKQKIQKIQYRKGAKEGLYEALKRQNQKMGNVTEADRQKCLWDYVTSLEEQMVGTEWSEEEKILVDMIKTESV